MYIKRFATESEKRARSLPFAAGQGVNLIRSKLRVALQQARRSARANEQNIVESRKVDFAKSFGHKIAIF